MSGPLNHEVIISAATTLFRVCVRFYPRRFRVEYGTEMDALFRRRMARASSAGSALSTSCRAERSPDMP